MFPVWQHDGYDRRTQRRSAEIAVDAARANAMRAMVTQAGQAGKLLRPGGAMVLECDSDSDETFTQWLGMVAPAFGPIAVAQLHRSSDGSPCVWLLQKDAEAADGEERGDVEIEIMQH